MSPPPQRLRVMMTSDAVGGVWVYSTMLARKLCRRGHQVVLVTLGPEPRSDQLRPIRNTPGLRVEVTDLALEWTDPEGADLPRARERLVAIERRVRPDLVHLNGYREASAGWTVPVIVAAHSCVRSWWRACRGGEPDESRWQRYIANVEAGLRDADAWVAPTASFRADVHALYSPRSSGRVIWNGVSAITLPADKKPFVLAAGRLWDEAKNISVLSDVAPHLAWPIRAAGPLVSAAARTGQTVRGVDALGEVPRPELLGLAQRASICVAPALYEPFGLAVLEAASTGCALVLSDIPTFRELWDGAALFIDPRDSGSIGAALAHLIADDAARARMQHRALVRSRRYALPRMVEEYQDLYRGLLNCALDTAVPPSTASIEVHA
jgi:glycosyltransferase involved in cell wall biosynthesis